MKTIAGIEAERKEGRALLFGKSLKVEQKLEELGEGQKPATIRTVIPFALKSLNDEDRTIEFVGSTATEDRYGDSIVQAGWDIANFLGNPVVPWGHNYQEPPVAKALEVGLSAGGSLTFKAQFATADEYAFADTIYKLYKGGYLRAFSVGFIPKDWEGDWQTGYTFKECELLEVSCVTVPANPEALVLAFKEGTVSNSERKIMVKQAETLIKTLTDESDDAQNEDMEIANALKELTSVVTELRDLLKVETKDAPVVEGKPVEESDKPEGEDPSGGADDVPTEEAPKDEAKALTPEEIRSAIQGATKDVLDYELGKIK